MGRFGQAPCWRYPQTVFNKYNTISYHAAFTLRYSRSSSSIDIWAWYSLHFIKKSGIMWREDTLFEYLENPKKYIKVGQHRSHQLVQHYFYVCEYRYSLLPSNRYDRGQKWCLRDWRKTRTAPTLSRTSKQPAALRKPLLKELFIDAFLLFIRTAYISVLTHMRLHAHLFWHDTFIGISLYTRVFSKGLPGNSSIGIDHKGIKVSKNYINNIDQTSIGYRCFNTI